MAFGFHIISLFLLLSVHFTLLSRHCSIASVSTQPLLNFRQAPLGVHSILFIDISLSLSNGGLSLYKGGMRLHSILSIHGRLQRVYSEKELTEAAFIRVGRPP